MNAPNSNSRREFLKVSGKITAASALASVAVPHVHAAEDSTIRLALVGCGGRGTGAVANAFATTGGPVKLVAMADLFEHRLKGSLDRLTKGSPDKVDVPAEVYHRHFEAGLKEVEEFAPEVVLVSAGFDAHKDDPIGGLGLVTEDFRRLTAGIVRLAERTAQGRVISALEGGYNLGVLGPCIEEHLKALDPSLER